MEEQEEPSTLPIVEEKRDPLVEVLNERVADIIMRNKELTQENIQLKYTISYLEGRTARLVKQVDMLIVRLNQARKK